jgi:hypothetical protein
MLGSLDLGLAMLFEQRLTFATEAAARCAAMNNTFCSTAEATQEWAAEQAGGLPGITFGNFTVNLSASCGASVDANYSYLGVVLPTINLAATACYPSSH